MSGMKQHRDVVKKKSPLDSAISRARASRFSERVKRKISGSKSNQTTPSNTPAVKPKTSVRRFRTLIATTPPSKVETYGNTGSNI